MTPFRATQDYPRWPEVAALIHRAFAYMEPRLGHPARAASVTPETLAAAAGAGSVWLVEDGGAPIACLFTRPSRDMADALYLGWLAVDETRRGRGLAGRLIAAAEAEARDAGHAALTLDTARVLDELCALFRHHGFREMPGEGEIVTFRKALA